MPYAPHHRLWRSLSPWEKPLAVRQAYCFANAFPLWGEGVRRSRSDEGNPKKPAFLIKNIKIRGVFACLSYLRRKYSNISYNFCAIWDKRVKKSLPTFNTFVLFETLFAYKIQHFCIVWYKNAVFLEILY